MSHHFRNCSTAQHHKGQVCHCLNLQQQITDHKYWKLTHYRSNGGEVECKSTGYPLHSNVSPSIPLPCVTVCHHVSTELYYLPLLCLHDDDYTFHFQRLACTTHYSIYGWQLTHGSDYRHDK